MLQQTILALDDAKRIAAAARAEADRNGWPMVIAILDDGGHLMPHRRAVHKGGLRG